MSTSLNPAILTITQAASEPVGLLAVKSGFQQTAWLNNRFQLSELTSGISPENDFWHCVEKRLLALMNSEARLRKSKTVDSSLKLVFPFDGSRFGWSWFWPLASWIQARKLHLLILLLVVRALHYILIQFFHIADGLSRLGDLEASGTTCTRAWRDGDTSGRMRLRE